jgi:hypothetical protein
MKAEINQWYVKWFLWNCRVLDQFTGKRRTEQYTQGTNLCHFFRTLLLGSMVAVLSVGLWAYLLISIFVMPFVLFNFVSVAISVGVAITLLAAAVALVLLGTVAPSAVAHAYKKITNSVKPDSDKPPGITQVAWAYIMGIKNRFCPTIRFDKDAR